MATEAQLIEGLRRADAAGNTQDAQVFADQIKAMRAQSAPAATPAPKQEGGALEYFARKPGWTYGSVLPIANDPEGGHHLALPDMVREPILSALGSGRKLEQGQVPQAEDYMPAVMGVVGSGIRAPASGGVVPSVVGAITPKAIPAKDKAAGLVRRAFERDKVSPENAAQVVGRYPDKDVAVMDAGGKNVAGLARTVRTMPGEGSEQIDKFLGERQADQHNRVLNDIATHFADGSDAHALSESLLAQRATASKPLYEEAFKANQSIGSPKIDRILETPAGKKALADARVKMQNDMSLMGVPDAELREQALEAGQAIPKRGVASGLKLRTLDYVKQALDDQVGAALKAGEKGNARILTGLKKEFVRALDEADVTARAGPNSTKAGGGAYARARSAFSGPSQSLDALTDGQDFLKMSPEALAQKVQELEGSDRDFFRIGAARSLQGRVSAAGDNHDAVSRVFGNRTLRSQIESVFGKDAVTKFAEAASAEKLATATNRYVRGGSNTADKLADIGDNGADVARQAFEGFRSGGVTGAIARPMMNAAGAKIISFFNGMTPEVRASIADLLTATDPGKIGGIGTVDLTKDAINYGANPRIDAGAAQLANALLMQPSGTNRPNLK